MKRAIIMVLVLLTVTGVFAAPFVANSLAAVEPVTTTAATAVNTKASVGVREHNGAIKPIPRMVANKAVVEGASFASREEKLDDVKADLEQLSPELQETAAMALNDVNLVNKEDYPLEGNNLGKGDWRAWHWRYADINGDGKVDIQDLAITLSNWDRDDCSVDNYWCELNDINRNGRIGPFDLRYVLRFYGYGSVK